MTFLFSIPIFYCFKKLEKEEMQKVFSRTESFTRKQCWSSLVNKRTFKLEYFFARNEPVLVFSHDRTHLIKSIPKIPLLTLVPTLWHLFCAWQMDKIFSKLSFPAGYLVSGAGTWTIAYSIYLHSTKMLCCGTIFRIIIALSWDWNGIAQITIYYCATFLIECYLLLNILFLIYLLSKLALGRF